MPVQGFVRLRKHQFGRQATFGSKVAAARAYPLKGVPSVDLAWTDPEVDTGSIDPVTSPYRGASELTAPLDFPSLHYNDLPLLLSGFFGGGVTPTPGASTARTWVYAPASEAPLDERDPFTYEFGDDVVSDWYQFGDGIIMDFSVTGPEGLGVLSASSNWRLGSMASTGSTDSPVDGTVPTPGLTVDIDPTMVYLKDGAIYIATTWADIDTSQISDALHTFTLRPSQEVDMKRWANGDQSFDIDAYGPGARAIELECTFAKTTDTVGTGSESDAWMSDNPINRYVKFVFTSTRMAEGIVPYSWHFEMPMRYYTRTEGEVGQNTVIVLTGHAFLDADTFAGVFKSTVVNTLDAADFDGVGS